MFSWLVNTVFGKFISTLILSMLPVVELRLGLPYGIALGLDYPLALLAAVAGNMLPVPFIVVYIRNFFLWIRRHWAALDGMVTRIENRAHLKSERVNKYGALGLFVFVAIPLPGTGAWTGALIAALLDMRVKHALPSIFLGVITAAAIMTGLTFGIIHIV